MSVQLISRRTTVAHYNVCLNMDIDHASFSVPSPSPIGRGDASPLRRAIPAGVAVCGGAVGRAKGQGWDGGRGGRQRYQRQ